MSASLYERFQAHVRDATLGHRRDELRVLRMVLAEIKQAQIELSDENVGLLLARMVKQRRDS